MDGLPRRTKIVATIGPACSAKEQIVALARAGMNAARLNLSHGSHDEHRKRAENVRSASDELGRPLALIADLQGPKLRLGHLPEPRALATGSEVVIAPEGVCSDGELPVSPAVIGEVLQPGHDVLIDDGHVRRKVKEVASGAATCEVLVGGLVSSHKGVNLPGVPIPIPSLTQKDMNDLEFALELGV